MHDEGSNGLHKGDEKAFPKKPSPTPEEALAWQARKRLRADKGSSAGIRRVRSLVFGSRARGE